MRLVTSPMQPYSEHLESRNARVHARSRTVHFYSPQDLTLKVVNMGDALTICLISVNPGRFPVFLAKRFSPAIIYKLVVVKCFP
jgi:hypothetical protein